MQLALRFASVLLVATGSASMSAAKNVSATSDPAYETALREKKRDFERYIAGRNKSSESELATAEALRKSREKREREQAELEVQYQRTMKRYSTEETEKRDREDEERIAKRDMEDDQTRLAYRDRQELRRELEAEIAPVDPYREFEINMAVAPESKVSHVESKSSQQ